MRVPAAPDPRAQAAERPREEGRREAAAPRLHMLAACTSAARFGIARGDGNIHVPLGSTAPLSGAGCRAACGYASRAAPEGAESPAALHVAQVTRPPSPPRPPLGVAFRRPSHGAAARRGEVDAGRECPLRKRPRGTPFGVVVQNAMQCRDFGCGFRALRASVRLTRNAAHDRAEVRQGGEGVRVRRHGGGSGTEGIQKPWPHPLGPCAGPFGHPANGARDGRGLSVASLRAPKGRGIASRCAFGRDVPGRRRPRRCTPIPRRPRASARRPDQRAAPGRRGTRRARSR